MTDFLFTAFVLFVLGCAMVLNIGFLAWIFIKDPFKVMDEGGSPEDDHKDHSQVM